MRKLLDKIYKNKLSLIIPLTIAFLLYLLFILFGTAEDKKEIIITTPILSLIWFLGVFFVIFIQTKNSMCPEWFLNIFELLVTIISCIFAVSGIISFIISGFQNFDLITYLTLISISAISWAHSKRS